MKAYPFLHKHPTSGQTTMSDGMDLRDWFAGMAMQGISSIPLPSEAKQLGKNPAEWLAENSYAIADAMMKQREVQHEQS